MQLAACDASSEIDVKRSSSLLSSRLATTCWSDMLGGRSWLLDDIVQQVSEEDPFPFKRKSDYDAGLFGQLVISK